MSSTIGGYCCPFDIAGTLADGSRETIARGALDFGGGVDLRIGHAGPPIARTGDGTLRLWADEFGLAFEADVADASSYPGCSIGLVIDCAIDEVIDGHPARRVTRGSIDHVALVSGHDSPAYPGTGAWQTTTLPYALPVPLRDLARVWQRGRPAETEEATVSHLHPNRRRARPVPELASPPAGRIPAPAAAPTVVALAQQPPAKSTASWFAAARQVMSALADRLGRLEARVAMINERGRDGRDGRDGRGVLSAEVDGSGCLVLRYSDGSESRVGLVAGPPGPRGRVLLPGE